MSEQVVDLLEAVEIDAENRKARATCADLFQDLRKMAIQRGAIRQVGQDIVAGHMQDALLGPISIGHVEGHCDRRFAAVIAQRTRLDRYLDYSSVCRYMTAGHLSGLRAPVQAKLIVQRLPLFWSAQVLDRHGQQLFAAVAVVAAGRGIDRQEFERVDVNNPHRQRVFLKEQAERRFPALQVGDVDAYANTSTIRRAPLLDSDPAIARQALFMCAVRLRVAPETLTQPFLLATFGFGILPSRQPEAKHVLETHA